MTQTQQAVAEAQANLEKAQEDLRQSQIEAAKQQLLKVRAEGRRLKRELDALVKTVRQAEAEVGRAEVELVDLNNAIHAHTAARPGRGRLSQRRRTGRLAT